MWLLKSEKDKERVVCLPIGNSVSIGRSDKNMIVLGEDTSVSRFHATLRLDEGSVWLQDNKSSYGTFVNGKRVEANQDTCILDLQQQQEQQQDGTDDPNIVIKFGGLKNEWRLVRIVYSFCFSCISPSTKNSLLSKCRDLGFGVTDDLDQSTHLVMNDFKSTQKGLLGLLLGKVFVSTAFITEHWNRLYCPLSSEQENPFLLNSRFAVLDPLAFVPDTSKDPATSNIIVNLSRNTARADIFQGCTFLFFEQSQMDEIHKVSRTGGALCILVEFTRNHGKAEKREIMRQTIKSHPQAILIRPEKQLDLEDSIVEIAKENGCNLINVADIGFAIIQCNPLLLKKAAVKRTFTLPAKTGVQKNDGGVARNKRRISTICIDQNDDDDDVMDVTEVEKMVVSHTKRVKKAHVSDDDEDDDDGYGKFVQKFNQVNNIRESPVPVPAAIPPIQKAKNRYNDEWMDVDGGAAGGNCREEVHVSGFDDDDEYDDGVGVVGAGKGSESVSIRMVYRSDLDKKACYATDSKSATTTNVNTHKKFIKNTVIIPARRMKLTLFQ